MKLALAASAALLTSVATSSAMSVSVPISFGPQLSDGATYSVFADQYDTSMGPLTSIEIEITATTSGGSLVYTLTNTTPGDLTLSLGTSITVSGPASLSLTPNPANTATFLGVDNTTVPDPSITANGGSDSDSQTITDPGDFAPYQGLGQVEFLVTGVLQQLSGGSNITGNAEAVANDYTLEGSVTYNFVPEPSSTALLGLAGLGLILRRRK